MISADDRQRIRDNFLAVTQEVAQATTQSGRNPDEVKIIGVTKYVDATTTAALVDVGCFNLGENRPQVMWSKAASAELVGKPIQWHMIGHVQRNKLRRMMRLNPMIHSVDSRRLYDAIIEAAVASNQQTDVLLEVNISGDDSKTGMTVDELSAILQQEKHPLVRVNGLMAMAGLGSDPNTAQKQFAAARDLRDQLATATGDPLSELSMGMSGDFAEAIAEGATMVRIGSRLFDGLI